MRWLRATVLLAAVSMAPQAHAQSALAGQGLFNTFCVFCHGSPPRGGPDRAAGNPALIRNAINTIPAMVSFQAVGFTDAQLADIAKYIRSLNLPAAGPAIPAFNYTDLWWTAAESGWGFNIVQHASNNIFAVVYTYELPNRPMWFVMAGGKWTSSTTFTGHLYRVAGAPGSMTFRPGPVAQVGELVMLFHDANNATIDYAVNGVHVTKQITRQPF
jgi:cytochrome c553